MKDIKEMTETELAEHADALVELGADSYVDFADLLLHLSANCEYILKYVPDCIEDDVEKHNLNYLRDTLQACTKMMIDCDYYFRNNMFDGRTEKYK